jgi:RNA polymerase sigma-70 factor, ECF subfamily
MTVYAMQAPVPQQFWHTVPAKPQPESWEAVNQRELIIIQQVLAGETQAFNQLVFLHQRLAFSVAYRILQQEELAAEAVQEAFVKAYRALHTFASGHFKNWLLRIVVNTCYDLLRAHRHQAVASLEDLAEAPDYASRLTDPAERPDAYAERMELRQWLEQGLRRLPADQRTVIVLHDVHGYRYEEIAEMLNISMGTVKSRIARGRCKLRNFLQPLN